MASIDALIDDSTLTRRQVETLTNYLRVKSREISFKQAAETGSKSVTVGSYFRTVQQGRGKIRASVLTVVVALWLGYVKMEDLRRLFEALAGGLPELEEEERKRVLAVVKALVDRIVL